MPLEKEVGERVKEALEFYADPECYKPQGRTCPVRGNILLQSDIQDDKGRRAREALTALEEEGK